MAVVRTCPPPELEEVSTPVGLAVTVTVCDCDCGTSRKSTVAGDPATNLTRFVSVLNPASVAETSYSPGRTPAKEYSPSSFVTEVNSLPVERFFKLMRVLGQRVCTWCESTVYTVPAIRAVAAITRKEQAERVRRAHTNLSARRIELRCRRKRPGSRMRTMVQQYDGANATCVAPLRSLRRAD